MVKLWSISLLAGMAALGPIMWGGTAAAEEQLTDFGCADAVLFSEGVARPQHRTVRFDGSVPRWGRCKIDRDRSYPLVLDIESCGWIADSPNGVARQTARVVYTAESGEVVEVSSCAIWEGTTGVVPLKASSAGCPQIHDWDAGVSYGSSRLQFEVSGRQMLAQRCVQRDDPSLVYEHKVRACEDLVTESGGRYAQSEVYIESSPARVIRQCQPNPRPDLTTVAGPCVGQYVHDMLGGQSYGTHVWARIQRHDENEHIGPAVTGCVQNPAEIYLHQEELKGWRHDDGALASYRQSDIYIDTPTGRIVLEADVERYPPFPYRHTGYVEYETGQRISVGCEIYAERRRAAVYERVDGSTVQIDRGPASPVLVSGC